MGKHRVTAGATYGRNGSFSLGTGGASSKRINPLTYGKTQSDGGRHIWEKRLFCFSPRVQTRRASGKSRARGESAKRRSEGVSNALFRRAISAASPPLVPPLVPPPRLRASATTSSVRTSTVRCRARGRGGGGAAPSTHRPKRRSRWRRERAEWSGCSRWYRAGVGSCLRGESDGRGGSVSSPAYQRGRIWIHSSG